MVKPSRQTECKKALIISRLRTKRWPQEFDCYLIEENTNYNTDGMVSSIIIIPWQWGWECTAPVLGHGSRAVLLLHLCQCIFCFGFLCFFRFFQFVIGSLSLSFLQSVQHHCYCYMNEWPWVKSIIPPGSNRESQPNPQISISFHLNLVQLQ